jgi:PAS domain S-box-containing protein
VHPDYKETARKRIEKMSKTGKGVGLTREKFVCCNGDVIDVELVSNPVIYEGKLAFQVVFRDITEQQQAMERVQQSEEKFRTLFEDSTDAIYISSVEGQFTDVNQSFLDLFGYNRSEIENLNAIELYGNVKSRKQFQTLIEQNGALKNYEITLIRKDGTPLNCIETATLRKDSIGEIIGYQGIIRDITEEIQAKEALLKTQKLESLGILAGGIAHDFNNLLTGIMGNVSAAKRYLTSESELNDIIKGISETSEKAAKLTNQLLAYSGKGKFMTELTDISTLIQNMQDLIRVSIHKTIDLKYSLDNEIGQIIVDKTQIEQVILNLVTNASEAIGEKVGTIIVETGEIYLDEERVQNMYYADLLTPGEYVYLSVEDNGEGMDEITQKRVFDPFFSTKFQGRGLGLAAVHGIIRAHNGGVELISEPFKGSKFKVYLPAVKQKSDTSQNEQIDTQEEWKGSGLVLLCDDDEILRTTVTRLLKILGFDVIIAKNGIEALELLRESTNEIDLVILDLTMPKMSGRETYIEIKKEYPELPIMLSSGYTEESVVDKFEGSQIDGFIQKPYTIGKLSAKLKTIFNS